MLKMADHPPPVVHSCLADWFKSLLNSGNMLRPCYILDGVTLRRAEKHSTWLARLKRRCRARTCAEARVSAMN